MSSWFTNQRTLSNRRRMLTETGITKAAAAVPIVSRSPAETHPAKLTMLATTPKPAERTLAPHSIAEPFSLRTTSLAALSPYSCNPASRRKQPEGMMDKTIELKMREKSSCLHSEPGKAGADHVQSLAHDIIQRRVREMRTRETFRA